MEVVGDEKSLKGGSESTGLPPCESLSDDSQAVRRLEQLQHRVLALESQKAQALRRLHAHQWNCYRSGIQLPQFH